MTRNHPDRSGQFMLNNRWLGKLMLKLMLSFSSFARNCPEWAWPLTVTPWRNLRRHLTLKTCTGTIRYDSSKILTFEDIWLPICAQRKFQSFFSCFFFLSEIVWPGRLLEFLDISSTLSVKFPLHTWHFASCCLECPVDPLSFSRPRFFRPNRMFYFWGVLPPAFFILFLKMWHFLPRA